MNSRSAQFLADVSWDLLLWLPRRDGASLRLWKAMIREAHVAACLACEPLANPLRISATRRRFAMRRSGFHLSWLSPC
jgi:hypothetical protein